jgi:UrcA family protein
MKSSIKNSSTKNIRGRLTLINAAVALTVGLMVIPAYASGPLDSAPTKVVKFQDLDVGTSAGIAALYGRISAASRHVCGADDGDKDLHGQSIRQACVKEAEARAIAQVNVPELAAYAEKKMGSHSPIVLAANKGN